MHSLPHYQHPLPGWCIYYNWWAYNDTSLSPTVHSSHSGALLVLYIQWVWTNVFITMVSYGILSLMGTILDSFSPPPPDKLVLSFVVYYIKLSKLPQSIFVKYIHFYSIEFDTNAIHFYCENRIHINERGRSEEYKFYTCHYKNSDQRCDLCWIKRKQNSTLSGNSFNRIYWEEFCLPSFLLLPTILYLISHIINYLLHFNLQN